MDALFNTYNTPSVLFYPDGDIETEPRVVWPMFSKGDDGECTKDKAPVLQPKVVQKFLADAIKDVTYPSHTDDSDSPELCGFLDQVRMSLVGLVLLPQISVERFETWKHERVQLLDEGRLTKRDLVRQGREKEESFISMFFLTPG